jgi:hypothetical protein
VDEEDGEDEDGGTHASAAQRADVDISPVQDGTCQQEEEDADDDARCNGGGFALIECRLEEADERGHGHEPDRQPPECRSDRRCPRAQEEHRNSAQAGRECCRRRG